MDGYKTKIIEIKYLTEHVLELTVDLLEPRSIHFQAGQFMQFQFGKLFRSYSICSVPIGGQTELRFCIELLPHGLGSEFFRSAQVGDEISMRGPLGLFTLNDFNRDVSFVATGVGIAPFVSMIPDALSRGYQGAMNLVFGVRHEEEVFYFDKFRQLAHMHQNFNFIPTLTRPKSHWPGQSGRVTTFVDVHYVSFKNHLMYVSGGMEMVKDARQLLLSKGHHITDIKLEVFI